ncbi:MAG: hypothetical protein D6677_02380 [Calditrichaeota bacterium]|nr:MAG: hypothetical protein D6677_02380 [Calditrichota bacterium]
MHVLELRPRFKLTSPLEPDEILNRLDARRRDNSDGFGVERTGAHTVLSIPANKQHYWSPLLSVEVLPAEQGALIKGHFGPRPAVWTMFMFFYMGFGFLGLMGLFWGMSQYSLNQLPWALWSVPVAIFLELILYFAARVGQKWAHDQMEDLRAFFLSILNA